MSEEPKTPKHSAAKATKRSKPEGKVESAVRAANKAEAEEKRVKEAARKARLAEKKTAEAEAKKAERKARHEAKQAEKATVKKEAEEAKKKPSKRDAKLADKAQQNSPLNSKGDSQDKSERASERKCAESPQDSESRRVRKAEAKEGAKEEGKAGSKRASKREKPKCTRPSFDLSWNGIKTWWLGHPAALVAVAAVIFLFIMLYPPTCSFYAALRTNQTLSAQLSDVTAERDELQSDVDKLTSEDGIKDEARRRGYVDEGDTAVDMEGIEDSGSATSDTTVLEDKQAQEEQETPWYIQALDFIFRYDESTQGVG